MSWWQGAWDSIVKLLTRPQTWTGINKFDLPIHIKESSTPSAITDYGAIYPKDTNALFFQDGAGVEHTVDLDGVPVADALTEAYNTLADGATVAIDWDDGNNQQVTLAGNRTYTFANIPDGGLLRLRQVQDGIGSRVPVWPATAKWPGDVTPTPTSTPAAIDIYSFISDGTNLELIGFAADVK